MAAEQRLLQLVPNDDVNEYTPAREALQLLRDARIHRPSLVLALAPQAVKQLRANTLEYWDIQEQVVHAAAHLGVWDTLLAAANGVCARFAPGASSRARLTHGLRREAHGRYDAATRTYIELLANDPTYAPAYKRQVALLKAQRRLPEAIAQCNHYLSYFATDRDAWAELAALCLQANRAAHALYAANELVLCDPNNHAAHTLVADVYLTAGTPADVRMARKHYAASLSARKSNNLRALYGLWLAASVLDGTPSLTAEESEHNSKLLQWAKARITAVYENLHNSDEYTFVLDVISEPIVPAILNKS